MRRVVLGMMAVVGLAAGFAGCGSDDERLTQEEFVTQGNAICKASSDRLDPKFEAAFGNATEENPPSEAALTAFVKDTFLPEINGQLDDLDKLNPPKASEDDFNAALAEARKAVEKIEDDPVAFATSDEDPFEKANELVATAGLDVCAEGGDE